MIDKGCLKQKGTSQMDSNGFASFGLSKNSDTRSLWVLGGSILYNYTYIYIYTHVMSVIVYQWYCTSAAQVDESQAGFDEFHQDRHIQWQLSAHGFSSFSPIKLSKTTGQSVLFRPTYIYHYIPLPHLILPYLKCIALHYVKLHDWHHHYLPTNTII